MPPHAEPSSRTTTHSKATLELAASLGYDPEDLNYPEPVIMEPKFEHRQSFLVLHGRGDTARHFAVGLLGTDVDGQNTEPPKLAEIYPHARFVFPTASKRPLCRFKNTIVPQWFDIYSIWQQREQEEVQFEGLKESVAFVHELIRTEIAAVGAENVVLWGLSQGCATSLIAMLLWEGDKIAACVGMCGWLPLRETMQEFLMKGERAGSSDGVDENRQGDSRPNQEQPVSSAKNTIKYLAETINIGPLESSLAFQNIPFFLGHGDDDGTVPVTLAREAKEFLPLIGANTVQLREYGGLDHWYSSEMLMDIVVFLKNKAGLQSGRVEDE